MDEKYLIDHWTKLRTQIISSQMAPALVLIGVFVTAAFGKFETALESQRLLESLQLLASTQLFAKAKRY
jgi:hypothetical protein